MSTTTRNSAQTPSYLIPGQHYLETFMPLSNSNQDHTFMGDYIIPILKQQTRLLLCLLRRIFPQTFSIALTVTMHILLRHLAAIIPSQFNNYFLPSYKTCSIKALFILAAIKPSWKPYSIFVLLPLFPTTLRGTNVNSSSQKEKNKISNETLTKSRRQVSETKW